MDQNVGVPLVRKYIDQSNGRVERSCIVAVLVSFLTRNVVAGLLHTPLDILLKKSVLTFGVVMFMSYL
jgi:hypothetical protein